MAENLQFELGKKLDHHFGARFCDKSNGDNPVARRQYVLTQLKWYYGEKGSLSAVTVQKSGVNFFNLFTRRPNLCSNISLKFY